MKIDTGMAVSAMTVGLSVPRNTNRITATNTEAPMSLPCKVVTEASMKLAWRKVTRGASMPANGDFFRSPSAASMLRVSAMVSAVGCFWMPRITSRLAFEARVPTLEGNGGEGHLGHLAQQHGLAVLASTWKFSHSSSTKLPLNI